MTGFSTGNITTGSYGFQSSYVNNLSNSVNLNSKNTSTSDTTAYYAKKGEPMYLKDMDADEDGIVSFDEFKEYCAENGISSKEMVRMVQLANSYRVMQAQKKASQNVEAQNSKNSDTENTVTSQNTESETESFVYAKRGDYRYDEVMDTNNDDKVTYKEYIEYCKEHSKSSEEKSDAQVEETDDGTFKVINSEKAVSAYAKEETDTPDGFVDDMA